MTEKVPQDRVSQPRKKRPLGRLAGNGLDADRPRPQKAFTAALMARRRTRPRSDTQTATADDATPPGVSLQTSDNRVTYLLRGGTQSLLLQRASCRRPDVQLLQTFHFTKIEAFDLWCESDLLRFEEPHLWTQLLRAGHDVLGGSR
jgi:hypothetical protein